MKENIRIHKNIRKTSLTQQQQKIKKKKNIDAGKYAKKHVSKTFVLIFRIMLHLEISEVMILKPVTACYLGRSLRGS